MHPTHRAETRDEWGIRQALRARVRDKAGKKQIPCGNDKRKRAGSSMGGVGQKRACPRGDPRRPEAEASGYQAWVAEKRRQMRGLSTTRWRASVEMTASVRGTRQSGKGKGEMRGSLHYALTRFGRDDGDVQVAGFGRSLLWHGCDDASGELGGGGGDGVCGGRRGAGATGRRGGSQADCDVRDRVDVSVGGPGGELPGEPEWVVCAGDGESCAGVWRVLLVDELLRDECEGVGELAWVHAGCDQGSVGAGAGEVLGVWGGGRRAGVVGGDDYE